MPALIASRRQQTAIDPWIRVERRRLLAQHVSRATREYLATLDDAAFGAASDVTPKFVSPSDPAAR